VEKSLQVALVNWRAPPGLAQLAPSRISMHRIRRSRSIVAPWLVVTGKHVADADANHQSASNRGKMDIDAHG